MCYAYFHLYFFSTNLYMVEVNLIMTFGQRCTGEVAEWSFGVSLLGEWENSSTCPDQTTQGALKILHIVKNEKKHIPPGEGE